MEEVFSSQSSHLHFVPTSIQRELPIVCELHYGCTWAWCIRAYMDRFCPSSVCLSDSITGHYRLVSTSEIYIYPQATFSINGYKICIMQQAILAGLASASRPACFAFVRPSPKNFYIRIVLFPHLVAFWFYPSCSFHSLFSLTVISCSPIYFSHSQEAHS